MQEWLRSEIEKDKIDVEKEKLKFLNEIKQFKKEDIVQPVVNKPKLTLWEKIKKIIVG
jgi:hypothetical protein